MSPRLDFQKTSPGGMKALGGVYAYLSQSGLPKTLIDLVYLRVSLINGCAFCIDMHTRDLLKDDVAIEKIVLVPVAHESGDLFSETEQAALRWAETVTRIADTGVPDSEFVEASKHFSEKELTDLTIAIGLMNTYNRLAKSFRETPAAAKQRLQAA